MANQEKKKGKWGGVKGGREGEKRSEERKEERREIKMKERERGKEREKVSYREGINLTAGKKKNFPWQSSWYIIIVYVYNTVYV